MLAATCAVACATAAPPETAGDPVYLALGDSVAFGYNPLVAGEAGVAGYPEALADQLGLPVTNASCPGEASGGFVASDGPDNGCRDNRRTYPLHVAYDGTQLAFAIDFLRTHPATALVTLDLGANDAMILQHDCDASFTCVLAGFVTMIGSYEHNTSFIFGELRKVYDGPIVALQIYNPTPADALSQYGVEKIDAALAGIASQYGVTVADGRAPFQAAGGDDPCGAGLLIGMPDGGCDIHPTARGHALLAGAIQAAL